MRILFYCTFTLRLTRERSPVREKHRSVPQREKWTAEGKMKTDFEAYSSAADNNNPNNPNKVTISAILLSICRPMRLPGARRFDKEISRVNEQ